MGPAAPCCMPPRVFGDNGTLAGARPARLCGPPRVSCDDRVFVSVRAARVC
jgi:hypothetical protein